MEVLETGDCKRPEMLMERVTLITSRKWLLWGSLAVGEGCLAAGKWESRGSESWSRERWDGGAGGEGP